VWNLDGYLAQTIADTVKRLRETDHGYPADVGSMVAWHDILTRIETPLRMWAECHHDMDSEEEERWMRRCLESLELLKTHFFGLWD